MRTGIRVTSSNYQRAARNPYRAVTTNKGNRPTAQWHKQEHSLSLPEANVGYLKTARQVQMFEFKRRCRSLQSWNVMASRFASTIFDDWLCRIVCVAGSMTGVVWNFNVAFFGIVLNWGSVRLGCGASLIRKWPSSSKDGRLLLMFWAVSLFRRSVPAGNLLVELTSLIDRLLTLAQVRLADALANVDVIFSWWHVRWFTESDLPVYFILHMLFAVRVVVVAQLRYLLRRIARFRSGPAASDVLNQHNAEWELVIPRKWDSESCTKATYR